MYGLFSFFEKGNLHLHLCFFRPFQQGVDAVSIDCGIFFEGFNILLNLVQTVFDVVQALVDRVNFRSISWAIASKSFFI